MTRFEAYQMLARVRDELEAARYALSAVTRTWDQHIAAAPPLATRAMSIGDLQRCLDHVELTYIMRLFAAFEAVLRDYWLNGVGRTTEPDLVQLLSSLHARQKMDDGTLNAANDVRRWRNKVIHRDLRALQYDFAGCASTFGRFVSWLPVQW